MFRSGGAPTPKTHSSYLNRPKPILQKMAEMAVQLPSDALTGPLPMSEPVNNTPRIAVNSAAKGKVPNSTLYPKTDIFFNKTESEEEVPEVPQIRAQTNCLIGGQDTSDRWTTTLMDASSGKSDTKKMPRGVKILSGDKATFLWGEGPSNSYHIRPKAETAPEEEEDDGTIEPESLSMLKAALISRGAKGILGLSKRFKIMDVRICCLA